MISTKEEEKLPIQFLNLNNEKKNEIKEEKRLSEIEKKLDEQTELNDQLKAQIIFLNDLNADLQQESQWAKMRLETLYNLYSSVQSPGCEAFRLNYTNSEDFKCTPKDGKTWNDFEKAKGKFTVTSSKKGTYNFGISGHYVESKKYPVQVWFRLVVKCDKLENLTLYYPNEKGTPRLLYDKENQEMVYNGLSDFCQGENTVQLQILIEDEATYKWTSKGGEIFLLLK